MAFWLKRFLKILVNADWPRWDNGDVRVERKAETLADFVVSLQERGQYTFSISDALADMGVKPVALKRTAERLKAKRRLATPRRGFYSIVPLEYRQSGAPPAASFIGQLMRFHDTPYQVGLLSAAEILAEEGSRAHSGCIGEDHQWTDARFNSRGHRA